MADSADSGKICRTDWTFFITLIDCGDLDTTLFPALVDSALNLGIAFSSIVIVASQLLLPFFSALSGDLRRQITTKHADNTSRAESVAYIRCALFILKSLLHLYESHRDPFLPTDATYHMTKSAIVQSGRSPSNPWLHTKALSLSCPSPNDHESHFHNAPSSVNVSDGRSNPIGTSYALDKNLKASNSKLL